MGGGLKTFQFQSGEEFVGICVENEVQWWMHLEVRLQTPMCLVQENECRG